MICYLHSWVESSWVESSWVESSWVETSWVEMSWVETSWVESSWVESSWTESNWIESIELNWTVSSWIEMSWTESSWIELSWIESSWIESSWFERVEMGCINRRKWTREKGKNHKWNVLDVRRERQRDLQRMIGWTDLYLFSMSLTQMVEQANCIRLYSFSDMAVAYFYYCNG